MRSRGPMAVSLLLLPLLRPGTDGADVHAAAHSFSVTVGRAQSAIVGVALWTAGLPGATREARARASGRAQGRGQDRWDGRPGPRGCVPDSPGYRQPPERPSCLWPQCLGHPLCTVSPAMWPCPPRPQTPGPVTAPTGGVWGGDTCHL